MQQPAVLLSSLTSLLALEPRAAFDGRGASMDGGGEDPFAALLAAISAPAGGEVLPADGKVLPVGFAAASLPGIDAIRPQGAAAAAMPPPGEASHFLSALRATIDGAAADGGRAAGEWTRPAISIAPPLAPDGTAAVRGTPDGTAAVGGTPDATEADGTAAHGTAAHGTAAVGTALGRTAVGGTASETAALGASPLPVAAADAGAAQTTAGLPAAETLRIAAGHSAAVNTPQVQKGPITPPEPRDADGRPVEAEAPLDLGDGLAEHAAGSRADRAIDRAAAADNLVVRPAAGAGAAGTHGADAGAAPSVTAHPSSGPLDAIDVLPSSAARAAHDAGAAPRGAPPDLGESVAGRVRMLIDQGTGEARLRLNPPELGTIDVRIAVVDDKTFVQLSASHAAGRDALEQSLPRLRELLAAGGLDVGGASVDGGRGGAYGSGAGDAERSRPRPWDRSTLDGGDSRDPGGDVRSRPGSGHAALGAAGRIDLYA